MPRGRPRLYKTPEEKAQANRDKSKRSYYKKKAALNARHAARYRHEVARNKQIIGARQGKIPPNGDPHPNNIPAWSKLVSRIAEEFRVLTKGSTRAYIDGLYQSFAMNYKRDVIEHANILIEAMKSRINRCEAVLLQAAGVGPELKTAQRVAKTIHEGLACLEDLMCGIMTGKAELFEMYNAKELMYQSLS